MTEHSLARSARTDTTEHKDAHDDELLAAAKAALAWFQRFDNHAPSDLSFGGEAKVRQQLHQAISQQRA